METWKTSLLVAILKERLQPAEKAEELIDELEGARPQARKAAVLVPLFERQGEPFLVFIRRASTLRAHSGEIAFPGGKKDEGDSSPLQTALREAEEEIGLAAERVEILGVLHPVFTVVSNYLITPVVGYLPGGLGTLTLQDSEVAELLLIPLRELQNPAIFHTEQWTRGQQSRTVYFYTYGPSTIWGATGRILYTLLEHLSTK